VVVVVLVEWFDADTNENKKQAIWPSRASRA
jgi:hypothetical protein